MQFLKRLARPVSLLPITVAIVAVLALAGGAAFAAHLANQRGIGPFDRTQLGTPAIGVTLPGQVPAFTKADVHEFFTLPPDVGGFPNLRTPDGKVPRIQSITFMSREQAQAYTMLHDSLSGLPADALVCVVVVNGPIIHVGLELGHLTFSGTLSDMAWPTATPVPAGPVVAYMVFDASTGNLLTTSFLSA